MHHISRAGVVWVRSWGKWSVMVIHYLIWQRQQWSFSSDSFLEVPIYWPLREKTLMANPKQPFRGHLLRQRGDTGHKRTLQPSSLFKYNPQEDLHDKQHRSSPRVGDYLHSILQTRVETLTVHQQMNISQSKWEFESGTRDICQRN